MRFVVGDRSADELNFAWGSRLEPAEISDFPGRIRQSLGKEALPLVSAEKCATLTRPHGITARL